MTYSNKDKLSSTFIPISERPNVLGASVDCVLEESSITLNDINDVGLRKLLSTKILNSKDTESFSSHTESQVFSIFCLIFAENNK